MAFLVLLYQVLCFLFVFLLSQVTTFPLAETSSPSSSFSFERLCHQEESLALLKFTDSFSINHHATEYCDMTAGVNFYQTWKLSKDCCEWNGVTCDNLTGHVIGLDVFCSGLFGTFHSNSTLFLLSHLQSLNLASNNFNNSPISPHFGKLRNLTHLDLSYSAFGGYVPNEVSHLSCLTFLDLTGNNLSGPIPNSLVNLTKLSSLFLSFNHFTGQLPLSVFNLTNLFMMYASGNNFIGPIPTPRSPSDLQYLALSSNALNGTIPSWIYDLPSLCQLVLADNQFTGCIGEFLHNSLLELHLDGNMLQGHIPMTISRQVGLTHLYLQSNNLSGTLDLGMFSNLSNLIHLWLSDNNFSLNATTNANYTLPQLQSFGMSSCKLIEFPPFLRHQKFLINLDLSNNQIQGRIPEWLGEVESLALLDLSKNHLSSTLLVPWKDLQQLKLHSNMLTGEIPIQVCNLDLLMVLDLSYNNFTGKIPKCLGNMSLMSVLDMQFNCLSGAIPPICWTSTQMRILNLNHNKIEGALPLSLVGCQELEALDLGNNEIGDTFPYFLGNLSNLQVLVLRSNRFHGPVDEIKHASSFSKLRILDLSHNMFSGPLPKSLFKKFMAMMIMNTGLGVEYMGYAYNYAYDYYDSVTLTVKGVDIDYTRVLTILSTVDLSMNNFSGRIPQTIALLKALEGLNLSHNNFRGHIPLSFENLSNLEWLDLSSNKLSGEIPSSLGRLTFLAKLNLSENDLSGPIPRGRQFDTFDNDSYSGNLLLCGPPLSKKCEEDETPNVALSPEDDLDPRFELSWKVVGAGYACGFVIGVSIFSMVLSTGKPTWLLIFVKRVQHQSFRRRNGLQRRRRN